MFGQGRREDEEGDGSGWFLRIGERKKKKGFRVLRGASCSFREWVSVLGLP